MESNKRVPTTNNKKLIPIPEDAACSLTSLPPFKIPVPISDPTFKSERKQERLPFPLPTIKDEGTPDSDNNN